MSTRRTAGHTLGVMCQSIWLLLPVLVRALFMAFLGPMAARRTVKLAIKLDAIRDWHGCIVGTVRRVDWIMGPIWALVLVAVRIWQLSIVWLRWISLHMVHGVTAVHVI